MPILHVEALTREAFAPFGDVIAPEHAKQRYPINEGTAMRFHDLARIDCTAQGGRTLLSLFRAQPRSLPFDVRMLERHPLGTQAFVPLSATPYLVVVGTGPEAAPRAFLATQGQGVNFRSGTWHHPLFALERESDFLVVDRGGPGDNCDEVQLAQPWRIESLS